MSTLNTLNEYAELYSISINYTSKYGCRAYLTENKIDIDKNELKKASKRNNIDIKLVEIYLLAHELGHIINATDKCLDYGKDEYYAWETAQSLLFEKGQTLPEEYVIILNEALNTYGVDYDTKEYHSYFNDGSPNPVPYASAPGSVLKTIHYI